MPHITLLAVFLGVFLGLAVPQGAQAAQAAAPTPEEKLAKQLYLSASPRKARIPPLKEGQIRISGPLNSLGQYNYDGGDSYATMRGCTWEKSRLGVMGHDSKVGDSAWFYADIDVTSGKVLSVTAYGNGTCGRYQHEAFFAAAPLVGSFGDVDKEGFTLRAAGPRVSEYMRMGEYFLDKGEASIVITGSADLLAAANGTKIPVKYYLGTGDEVVMEDKDPSGANIDSGRGTVTVERFQKAADDVIPTGKYVVPGLDGGATLKKINDTTYSFDVDLSYVDERNGLTRGTSFRSDQCRPKGDMLVCRTEGVNGNGKVVPMNVRLRQVSPGKLKLDADDGVRRYWCGASMCFDDDYTFEKQ